MPFSNYSSWTLTFERFETTLPTLSAKQTIDCIRDQKDIVEQAQRRRLRALEQLRECEMAKATLLIVDTIKNAGLAIVGDNATCPDMLSIQYLERHLPKEHILAGLPFHIAQRGHLHGESDVFDLSELEAYSFVYLLAVNNYPSNPNFAPLIKKYKRLGVLHSTFKDDKMYLFNSWCTSTWCRNPSITSSSSPIRIRR